MSQQSRTASAEAAPMPDRTDAKLGWLWRLCGELPFAHTVCRHPWTLTFDGRPHAAATNGHILFLIPGDHGFAAPAPGAFDAALKSLPTSTPRPFPADQARQLFGFDPVATTIPDCDKCQNTGRVKCRDCDGVGAKECNCECGDWHTAQCEECENGTLHCDCLHTSGTSYDRRIITIDGVPFKYDYVRRALAHLPTGATTWQNDHPNKAGVLRAGGFTAVVMPLREVERKPEFAIEVAA